MTSNDPRADHGGIIAATKTGGVVTSDPKFPIEKKKLQKEGFETQKTIHNQRGAIVVNSKASSERSAVNQMGSHFSAAGAAYVGGGGRGSAGNALRLTKPKPKIVVAPSHPIKNTSAITVGPTGISSRIQKLKKGLGSGGNASTDIVSKVLNVATPPVPGLTSILPSTHSCRKRDYLVKQSMINKNFQEQINRKIVKAAYPKAFRQIWPVIPTKDSIFLSNYGLESIYHHLNSSSSDMKDENEVKPICYQCGYDFASAWRKCNSKQLPICEVCDIKKFKLQHSHKIKTQLKEFMESMKEEEGKFRAECKEASQQVLSLEKWAAENPPPPLISDNVSTYNVQSKRGKAMNKQASLRGSYNNANTARGLRKELNQNRVIDSNSNLPTRTLFPISAATASTSSTSGQQKSYSTVVLNKPVVVSRKRKEPPGGSGEVMGQVYMPPPSKVCKPSSTLDVTLNQLSQQSSSGVGVVGQVNMPPPIKVCKPGSVLDLTLNWPSRQYNTQKLFEKRFIPKDAGPVGGSVETERLGIVKPVREWTTGVAKQDRTVTCVTDGNISSPRSAGKKSATPGPGSAGNNSATPGPGSSGNNSATPGPGGAGNIRATPGSRST